MNDQVFCDVCNRYREKSIVSKKETFNVKGEKVTISANVVTCTHCKNTIYEHDLDKNNLRKAYEKYRRRKGLLSVEQIKEIRKKYGFSQRGLSSILGWSPTTIARYEVGSLPSLAHNEQLKRIKDDQDYTLRLYKQRKQRLNKVELKRTEKIFSSLESNLKSQEHLIFKYLQDDYSNHPPEFRGKRDFDIDKITHMVLFFINKTQKTPKSKLLKLLYYSDFMAYKTFGVSISGTVYCRNHFGPIPRSHDALIEYLKKIEAIDTDIFPGPYEGEIIVPKMDFSPETLPEEEIEILSIVLEKFKNTTATQLSTISHNEIGFKMTEHKCPVDYKYSKELNLGF